MVLALNDNSIYVRKEMGMARVMIINVNIKVNSCVTPPSQVFAKYRVHEEIVAPSQFFLQNCRKAAVKAYAYSFSLELCTYLSHCLGFL